MANKLLSINNIGDGGLNSDIVGWELPPNMITVGENFRAAGHSLKTAGSNEDWSTDNNPTPVIEVGHVLFVGSVSSESIHFSGIVYKNKVRKTQDEKP